MPGTWRIRRAAQRLSIDVVAIRRKEAIQEEGGHEAEDPLEHQGEHGEDAAGNDKAPQLQDRGPVKKGIKEPDSHHEGQYDPQFVKTASHIDSADLVEQDRPQNHGDQSSKIILVKGECDQYVEDRGSQLDGGMKSMDRGLAGSKRIHFGKLPQGFLHFIH